MTVISVIGPDARAVEQVTAGVRTAAGRPGHPGRRFTAGAGHGEADGVVAVVTSPVVTAEDMEVVRAVRDAMGVVVVYTGDGTDLADEAGVVHCAWGGDGPAGPSSLAGLVDVIDGMWVDMDRWEADARRADADRLDRVRIAVRLAADRIATDLLDEDRADVSGAGGADELDRLFRARLSVAVLQQGVEMPHLAEVGAGEAEEGSTVPTVPTVPGAPRETMSRVVTGVAAVGAGLAASAAALRVTDSVVIGMTVGLVVMVTTATARWWTGRVARREQDRARLTATLRRRWAATVTDVIARIDVPTVAGRLPGGAS
ncbi:hypothetical protein [Corynebacterium glyciniphilum]|uniref:hypothetical protein n=1 Tax=Corynebacterium glyciniphilum TaxID=1404244 RepID=UPI0011AB3BAD|nr:hypothetical protein [Corynebacterium glyciniphilum]